MIIAAQRVAADIAQRRVFKCAGEGGIGGKIIHSYADNPQGTGQKLVWAGAHHAVSRHPLHFAMILFVQPCLQLGLAGGKVGVSDPDLLKTQFSTPLFDAVR